MEQRNDLRNEHYDEQYKKMQRNEFFDTAEKRRMVQALIFIAAIIAAAAVYLQLSKANSIGEQVAESVSNAIIGEEGKVSTITETTLTDIIKETKLYTAEYPYNGYVAVPDGRDGIKYYAAYEGSVKAGFDVNEIELTLDEDTKTITIKLPEISIDAPTVNAGTIEYIFKDKKANTETVAQEAYKYSLTDLTRKVYSDEQLKQAATDSAKTVTKQLIEPWINSPDTDEKYTVIVTTQGEELPDEGASAAERED